MDSNKARYMDFCKTKENISIFSQYWWLDAVCGADNWDVIIIEKGGKVAATMPYYFVNKKGVKHILMPLLTQTLGPYIVYPSNQKYENRLSFEKEVLTKIINQLPDLWIF
ncbi:MAG: hypothetical protein U5N56_00800 [Candidatus Marinimicrobia bacterium]|nr:hypothetical protein [Candidatus Neomarinimicrobiota bacterium]